MPETRCYSGRRQVERGTRRSVPRSWEGWQTSGAVAEAVAAEDAAQGRKLMSACHLSMGMKQWVCSGTTTGCIRTVRRRRIPQTNSEPNMAPETAEGCTRAGGREKAPGAAGGYIRCRGNTAEVAGLHAASKNRSCRHCKDLIYDKRI